jgi:hypothetical protein
VSPRYRYARAPRTRRVAGTMNKGEQQYHDILTAQQHAGGILEFKYEGLTIKLANDVRFTADFFVVNADSEVELHEVKPRTKNGKYYAREDAVMKMRLAATHYPFRVFVCWPADRTGVHWHREEVAA